MSISNYLMKSSKGLRMPKGKDSTGIHFEGAVLTGQKSLEQRHHEVIAEVTKTISTGSGPLVEVIPSHLRPPDTRYKSTL